MMSKTFKSPENLYRSADGVIVREGDRRAAFHVVRAGSLVPEEWVKVVREFLGGEPDEDVASEPVVVESDEPTVEAAVTETPDAPDDGEKAAVKTEDKAADTAPNKAAKKAAKKTSATRKRS